MKNYSTYWRTTIFASIVFHFLMGLALTFILPKLIPEPKFEDVQELTWVDVDLTDDVVIVEEAIPVETIEPEVIPEFEFPPLIIPDPEPVYIEPPPTPEPEVTEQKPPEPEPEPQVAKDENEALKKLEDEKDLDKKNIIVVPKESKQQLGQPPVTITEFYPPTGSGLGYKGYVSVAATIGKDGTVKKTKIMRTSGRMMVDGLAQDYAKKWTFKPALDQDGKPMECDKIITFDFRKFAAAT